MVQRVGFGRRQLARMVGGGGDALSLDFVHQAYFPTAPTTTRNSTGTYYDAAGVMQTAAIDAARLDHNPLSKAALGLLVEGAKDNLFLWSQSLANVAWTQVAAAVNASAILSPDGVTTMERLTENSASSGHYVRQSVNLTQGQQYTLSVFAKEPANNLAKRYPLVLCPADAFTSNLRATYNAATGAVSAVTAPMTAAIENVGNGIYRCKATATATVTSASLLAIRLADVVSSISNYLGDGVSGMLFCKAQFETGAASSYILSEGTIGTRAADKVTISTAAFNWNGGVGVLRINDVVRAPVLDGADLDITASDAGNSTHIRTVTWTVGP